MWKSVQKRDRIIWKSGNPYEAGTDKTFSLDTLPQEYTAYGNGDYRINGLTVLEECHYMYHGEKVAFGTLAQLVLENVLHEELEEIIMWCIEVGLPVTLGELGAGNVTDEQLMEVARLQVQKVILSRICHLQLHRRVYLQRSRQQMHMADII